MPVHRGPAETPAALEKQESSRGPGARLKAARRPGPPERVRRCLEAAEQGDPPVNP